MAYYINDQGIYYTGNREHVSDIEVPERPDPTMKWNGSAWVIDSELEKLKVKQDISKTDDDFIRVVDDLIQVLIDSKVITLKQLPQAAQNKITARNELRKKL